MIRLCNLHDEAVWLQLNKEFIDYEYQDENVWENPLDKGDMRKEFRDIIMDSHSPNKIYIIEEAGNAIGFMNTATFTSIWAHGKAMFLDDFFIRDAYRGQGHGHKALMELEALIKADGYVRLQLMAEDTNPAAVRFYEREGYSRQKINFFCKYL